MRLELTDVARIDGQLVGLQGLDPDGAGALQLDFPERVDFQQVLHTPHSLTALRVTEVERPAAHIERLAVQILRLSLDQQAPLIAPLDLELIAGLLGRAEDDSPTTPGKTPDQEVP
mgnify:CR=1 FL=1